MKLRAMIVEDCPSQREMLKLMLRATVLAEFDFTEAEDGLAALSTFTPRRVDLLFVDWNTPKMSGIEFVRAIRARPEADHIPIVMITGENTLGHVEDALDGAGADAYITKPYTLEELRRRLVPVIRSIVKQRQCDGNGEGFATRRAHPWVWPRLGPVRLLNDRLH